MKRARRQSILIVLIVSGICIGFYGVHCSTRYILQHAPVSVHHDALLSNSYTTILEKQLTDDMHMHGPSHLINAYKQYSPLFTSMNIRYTHPLHATIWYELLSPYVCFNDTIGLLSDDSMILTNILTTDFLQTLPHIQIPDALLAQEDLPRTLKHCFKNITADIYNRFTCNWHDEHTCYYHDRNHEAYTLVYEGYTTPTTYDIALYDTIIAQHMPNNKKTEWLIDLRFKNQAILSQNKGL